jgi:hypothetical protein
MISSTPKYFRYLFPAPPASTTTEFTLPVSVLADVESVDAALSASMVDDDDSDTSGQCISRARWRSFPREERGMINSRWQKLQDTLICES